jgi:two-component system response regulator HydG
MELLEGLSANALNAERAPRRPVARQRADESDLFREIVAQSAAMRQVTELARLSATTDYTVLILGESGTGKDLLARAIHAHSRRCTGPLVVVNSARLSSGVEDSELFGHARGAFTGALQETSGLVAAAHRGTLFLDEIGELAPTSQAKMLRCLETGEVRRVGDTHAHEVDIRLIAATNRDLRREIEAGTFREDLYYRLAIITIYIPPLRERPEDIPLLADRFLQQIGEGMGREPRIAQAALDLLVRFPWPGNARQLDSCLRHAALLAGDAPIAEEHLPGELSKPIGSGGVGAPLSLAALERQHILEVLAQCGHDRQRAQRLLGISRATLQRRLTEYDIRA